MRRRSIVAPLILLLGDFIMTRLFKMIIIYGFLLTLGACVPMTFENYTTGSGMEDCNVVTVNINGKKEDFMISAYIPVLGAVPKEYVPEGDELWIAIYAFRRSYDGDPSYVARHDVPMLYSTQDAYVKSENGNITKAYPEIYFSQKNGPIAADHQQMVNINVPQTKYLRFNTLRRPGSEWRLHLGKITINDVPTEFSDFKIIFRKDKVVWKPLMMP